MSTTPARRHVQPADVTDLSAGFLLREAADGVYVISNGNYQTLFATTGEGVVLVDAPEPLIEHLPTAIADVTDEPIRTIIYSHGHSDHIGGTHLLAGPDVEIVAEERIAQFLQDKADPRRPIPTTTFAGRTTLVRGSRTVELVRDGFHSADGDLLIYLPAEKVLVGIDLLAHGWVPLLDFDISENMFEYIRAFDRILGYDFTAFISGHTADLASRDDVLETQEYVQDVYRTVKRLHDELSSAELLAEARDSEQAGIKWVVEEVSRQAAADVATRWADRLKGVDLWTESHCRAMTLYVRWTD
jgi:glyoxylase-like metal-dependent hydrolase (beta-lactamase superfamily II)